MHTRRTMLKGGLGVLAWGATSPLHAEALKNLIGPMCGEENPSIRASARERGSINGFDPSYLKASRPLAFEDARFTLFLGDPVLEYGEALTAVLNDTLNLIGMDASDVLEIRLARWGHALPLARVGFLGDGIPDLIRAPYKESMHFVNQDNWALPAIENSLLDAFEVADTIKARLG